MATSDSSPLDPQIHHPDTAPPPELFELFLAFAKMSLAGFGGVLVWARRAIVEQHRWMTPDQFNEAFALCHFLPGPNIVNLSVVFGARFRGIPGSIAAFLGLLGPPVVLVTGLAILYSHYGEIPALQRMLNGVSCAAVGLFRRRHLSYDGAAHQAPQSGGDVAAGSGVHRGGTVSLSAAVGLGNRGAAQHRGHLCRAHADQEERGCVMNNPVSLLFSLAVTFGLMSLLAIGGANSTIPEMHRVAVDVQHWMSDGQFADMFAISQLSPGPERADRDADRLSCRGLLGAGYRDTGDVRAVGDVCLYRRQHVSARQSFALALAAAVRACSALHRPDVRERLRSDRTADHSWVGLAITVAAAAAAIGTSLIRFGHLPSAGVSVLLASSSVVVRKSASYLRCLHYTCGASICGFANQNHTRVIFF